ncbi:MAG TPA: hypothetical protein VGO52_23325 [Hyphomonadaceae bacterium]|nr:hypothetical protein [Hyphomonadaceae bacterium]
MTLFTGMSPAQAAAFNIGLLVILMMTLKVYVGARRRQLKLASGDSHPDFNRAVRVQLNAVEDVPASWSASARWRCSACRPGTSTQ